VATLDPPFALHLQFVPQAGRSKSADPDAAQERGAAHEAQIEEIVALIQSQMGHIEQARANGEKFRVAVLGRARSALAPIALALREAEIPFRAVDLESLADRAEILDALALARALLNPQDRVAWLGILRAPWCGLSLADLHTLAGKPELRFRPVPELLAERLSLLSADGHPAAARVLRAVSAALALRGGRPAAALGTWLEQAWKLLGGEACVDAIARVNLNLLWKCLDSLPNGEEDLFGPGVDAALDKLTAQPDPVAASDCGVQLMTIHKSKGLEFEVVIVPELQATGRCGGGQLLTWLERGLSQPEDSGEITEFLIAPLQSKGADRGKAKTWVDQVYRERESQEVRRILYVAATRAREQLHLFARPAYKAGADGVLSLVEPANSLLATAWPALETEVRARFEGWKATATEAQAEGEGLAIAASGEGNLLVMPSAVKATRLRRLPTDFQTATAATTIPGTSDPGSLRTGLRPWGGDLASETRESALYIRHEGGMLSRALGSAVHFLLEELARLRTELDWKAARVVLSQFEPRLAAQVRATGVDQPRAAAIAAQALHYAIAASHDPIGAWVLSPHVNAASEVSWAGVAADSLRTVRTVRVDRVFQAGLAPSSERLESDDCWWIIDYKTAHAESLDPAVALPELREIFAPQVEAYARFLRNLHGADVAIRVGLYYPRILQFDWWQM
jgi:ATP-dependent exoDNAse (exonuclease V) beta subunit